MEDVAVEEVKEVQETPQPSAVEPRRWTPFPKQVRFLTCPAFELLYGGAAGGGKSDALLIAALDHCRHPGAKVLLLRRKFVDLERSLIRKSFEFYSGRGRYDSQRHRWTFKNGTFIEFGHCQTMKDLDNYYSAEYTFIGVEQAEQFTEEMYLFFFSRVRTTNPRVKCLIRLSANPVGIGRGWLARRFGIVGKDSRRTDKCYPVTEEVVLPDGSRRSFTYQRCYIPARVYDNTYLMENDPQYLMRLNQLPEEKRKALLDGRWDAFEGAFFTEFDPKVHVCEPFEIPANWKRSISFDWGYSDPMVCHWWAEDMGSGKLYCYRELYTKRMIDIDVARNIARMSYGENIDCIYYPWDLDFKSGQTGVSMRERMDNEWMGQGTKYYLKAANKDRKNGWAACRYLLSLREDKEPRMKIFSTCKELIEKLPEQIHDDNDPEDLDTLADDHAADSFRYMAASYRQFFEKPAIPLGVERARLPVDVGSAMKYPDGTFHIKPEASKTSAFAWLGE